MWTTRVDNVTETWGVRAPVFIGCAAAAVLGGGWAVFAARPSDRVVASALVLFALVAALSCVPMRRRLTADRNGLVVRGPGGTRTVAWTMVTGVEVVRRSRLGIASSLIELDLADDGLIVLGRFDLGADPEDVARVLKGLWGGRL